MNRIHCLLAAAIAAIPLSPRAASQGQPNGQMPAAMRAKMKAWETWRKSHKSITTLEQTIQGLSMMEGSAKTRLSKVQAKRTVAVLKAWRHKPVMTNVQARTVNKQITGSLTLGQLKVLAMASRTRQPGGPGGPGGPPPGGPPPGGFSGPPPGGPMPGGPGGPGGPMPGGPPPPGGRMSFPSPKEYNPLNPDTLPFPPERERTKWILDRLSHDLSARSKK